jgi:predicted transcriptional regulator
LRSFLLVVALLAVASGAVASAPLSGELRADPPLRLEGDVRVSAASAVLDLAPDVGADPPRVSWDRAWGYSVDLMLNETAVVPTQSGAPVANDSIDWGPGSFLPDRCAPHCLVLALAEGNGTLALQGAAEGPLGLTAAPQDFGAMNTTRSQQSPDAFGLRVPEGRLWAGAGAPFQRAQPNATGEIHLVLSQVDGILTTQEGSRRLETASYEEPYRPVAMGPALGRTIHDRFVYLTLEGARIDAGPGSAARLFAPAADLRVGGVLSATVLHGWMSAGGAREELAHEPLVVEGALRLVAASPDPALAAEPGVRLTLGGEADRVVTHGLVIETQGGARLARAGVAAALLALLAALAALAYRHGILWSLYSRLRAEDILANANRARILATVRAEPGLHVTALRRRVSLSEAVVRHHLNVLRAHGWVVLQKDGRARRVFAVEARQALEEHGARRLQGAGGRSLVARALCAERRGLTQRELMARTGLAQRLVSYHLARMVDEGAVERAPGRPQRYAASEALLRAAGAG